MERGLLWLPLLMAFFALAWAGWYEYQRVEAYRRWASSYDRAKYDVRAVLAQKDDWITWGKPTRGEPAELETFSLQDVRAIVLYVGDRPIAPSSPLPPRGNAALNFELRDRAIAVPFTDIALAARWRDVLAPRSQETAAGET